MEKRWHFSVWYLLLALLLAFWFQSFIMGTHQVLLSYSDFKKAVVAG
jgi:hypothetical protein